MIPIAYLFETKILKFPTHRQTNSDSCGAAVTQSVLAYYGIDETQDDLAKELKMSENGIEYTNIVKALKKRKLKIESGLMDQQMLKDYVNKKFPVIILMQAYKDNRRKIYSRDSYAFGHYVTVIGYDNSRFIIEDPVLNNKLGYISFPQLDIRWHGIGKDENDKLDNHGIAVIGTPKYKPEEIVKVV